MVEAFYLAGVGFLLAALGDWFVFWLVGGQDAALFD